jgi:integrase
MAEIFERWLSCMLELYKPSTRRFLQVTVNQLRRAFRTARVTEISAESLQAYVSSLRVSPKTVANRITVFRTIWKSARTWGYVSHDPFAGVILPKLTTPESRCLSSEEVQLVLAHAPEPYKTLYLLAAETGMRGGEICALEWSDVDLDGRTVRVRRSAWKGHTTEPKTRAGRRTIAISDHLGLALASLRSPRTGRVFVNQFGRAMDQEKVVQRNLRPLLKSLGLPSAGLHAFRHFNATLMDAQSIPMKMRQTRLGHSSCQTTLQLYTHIARDQDFRAAERLGAVLRSRTASNQHRATPIWFSSTTFGVVSQWTATSDQ